MSHKTARIAMSEVVVVERVVEFLHRNGYRVRTEVPNMGQSADVVATRSRWVTMIEAKVKDWSRALDQCLAHEQVADFICVAVGTISVSSALEERAQQAGYGIIHCPPDASECRLVVPPRANKNVWKPQRHRLSEALRNIDHER